MTYNTADEIAYIDSLGTHSISLDARREGVSSRLSTEEHIRLLEQYLRIAEERTLRGNWVHVDGHKVEAYARQKIAQLRGQ